MKHAWSLSFVILLWSTASGAALNVRHLEVNGYEVHLIDLGRGQEFGFVFGVPYGAADDPPSLFGRAHLFEHMFLRGSSRHPGAATIDDVTSKYGFTFNAYTGLAETIYHAVGTDEHGLDVMPVVMGALDRPELLPGPYAKEHGTVVEEVVKQAPNNASFTFTGMPFAVLPREGNFLRGRHYGDAATLNAMTADHLRALHDDVYHGANVKVAVVGNFTSGRLSEDDVLRNLREILPAHEPKAAYVPFDAGPVFADEKILDVYKANESLGRIAIPVADGTDPRAVRAFTTVFANQKVGGVLDRGRDLGWLTSLGVWEDRVGAHDFVFVDFQMTDAGYRRRREVANWILAAIDATRSELYSEELLSQVRSRFLNYFVNLERDASRVVENVGRWLPSKANRDFLDGDWEKVVATLTPEAVREGARALSIKHKTLSFLGPEREGKDHYDDHSHLSYAVEYWDDQTSETPTVLPSEITLARVDLPVVTRGATLPAGDAWFAGPHETFVRTTNPEWTERTVVVRLDLPAVSFEERANLRAWAFVVEEKLRAEYSTLLAEGVHVDLTVGPSTIDLFAAGDSGREFAAIDWLLDRMGSHQTDPEILDRYRINRRRSLAKAEEGFAGQVAARLASHIAAPWESDPIAESLVLDRLTPASLARTWARLVTSSHKTLVVAGPASQEEIDHSMTKIRALSPRGAPYLKTSGPSFGLNVDYREPWRDEAQSGVGLARFYAGAADADVDASLALQVATRTIHERVFPLARPYGYVQSVYTTSIGNSRYGLFTGQAGEEEHVETITKIWDRELAHWAGRHVALDEIEDQRKGLSVALGVPPSSSRDAAYEALTHLRGRGDPFFRPRARAILDRLTPEDVLFAADRHLSPGSKSFTVVKGVGEPQSCEALLAARAAVKKILFDE